MSDSPEIRRKKILEWLQSEKTLSIEALITHFGVSAMTIHRDLDFLSEEGLVQKSYGQVTLVPQKSKNISVCPICQNALVHHDHFVLHTAEGDYLNLCCAHCGLLWIGREKNFISALAPDFLYKRMVNVLQATYLLGSRVGICCVPSILTFASLQDAMDFQRGFGGIVMSFEEILDHLRVQHSYG